MWSIILVSSAVASLVAVAVAIVPDDPVRELPPGDPPSSHRPRRHLTRTG